MRANQIKSFTVYGLFGTDDVHITFDGNIKVLIGENGIGKTQVLNLFYYTLTQNFFRLAEFSFDKLVLEFRQNEPIEITKKNVDRYLKDLFDHPMLKDLIEEIGYSQFEMLRNKFFHSKNNDWRRKMEEGFYSKRNRKIPFHHVLRVFEEMEMKKGKNNSHIFEKCEKQIQQGIKDCSIMYFPTYRRVEEDLHSLGYDDDEILNQENTLIQFGMDDVQKRFNYIEGTIDKLIKDGFSKFSSELVNQFFKDDELSSDVSDKGYLDNIDENDIQILLSRIGDKISDSKKSKIKEIVLKKEMPSKDDSLNLLLKKLIENYSPQKELDQAVKEFRDVCNKYLVDKKVFYDESAIKIFIKSSRNDSAIALSKLSSGEKQIISMFSKIYLSDRHKRFIILFDEPELSLSMPWQKQLLPDVINSKKCDFLLAVTHSPFIFDNELEKYAIGLGEYLSPLKKVLV